MSEEMKQGKTYEPGKEEKKTPPKKNATVTNTSKKPPNKNIIYIIAGILAVVVIGVGGAYAFGFFNKDSTEPSDGGGFFSGLFGKEEELIAEEDEWYGSEELNLFEYTEEEKLQLAEAGVTADKIMQGEADLIPASTLIAQMEEEKEKLINEKFPELKKEALDGASDSYKKLLNKTYLGLKPFTIKVADEAVFNVTVSATETVPYEKLGSKGHQNFVKLKSYKYDDLYVQVPPTQYMQMRDTGSILAHYIVYTDDVGNEIISDIRLEIVDYLPE